MSRLVSTHARCTTMRATNIRWIAAAIISLFTHISYSQGHQDLTAAIAGGNHALSEAVYGLNTTAYGNSAGFDIEGDGSAQVLKFKASDFSAINFNDEALNQVSTVVIRFNQASLLEQSFDGSLLAGLENLSSVVLMCTVEASASDVSSIALGNLPSGANSYYVISIPE